MLAVVGCSASGDTGEVPAAPAPTQSTGTTLPPSNPDDGTDAPATDGGKKADSGSKDAGSKDAAKDAGPPPPDPGTACTTPNQIFKRSCGTCGTQEAICIVGDSGTATVSDYGDCTGQVVNGCTPGATDSVACGNCGTQTRTCSSTCEWTLGSCSGQPTNSCTPGSIQFLSAGCSANTYRQQACKTTCTWDNASATCTAPPTFVTVPSTVGSINNTIAVLSSSQTTGRLVSFGSTCPSTDTISTTLTPYSYIEVRNTNAKPVKVSIYNSQATGGPVIDTLMAAYTGTTIPTSDAARKACVGSIGDYGDDTLTGDSEFASISGVTIPANSSVQVYSASYYAYDSSDPTQSTGMIMVNVKVESIGP